MAAAVGAFLVLGGEGEAVGDESEATRCRMDSETAEKGGRGIGTPGGEVVGVGESSFGLG